MGGLYHIMPNEEINVTDSVPAKIEEIKGADLEENFQLSMPEVNTAAVTAHEARESEEKKAAEVVKASAPGFDHAIHAVDGDGKPKKNKDGSFQLKRGRKANVSGSGAVAHKSSFTAPNKQEAAQTQEATRNGQRDLAIITAQSLDGVLCAALSDEMAPSPEEFQMTVNAWERLYVEKGVEDLPPWAALTVIYTSRIIARSDKPKVKKRLGMGAQLIGRLTGAKKDGFWDRVSNWFRGIKGEGDALADSKETQE